MSTRTFNFMRPIVYKGNEYPTTVFPVEDYNGNISDMTVFADKDGMYHTFDGKNKLTSVMLQHDLPELIVKGSRSKSVKRQAEALRKAFFGVTPENVHLSPTNNSLMVASSEDLTANQQRQAIMRAAGYNVPNDGTWNSYQQGIWDKLNTHKKEYDTTLKGLGEGLLDHFTGNTTYKIDMVAPDNVTTHNDANVDWELTNKSQNKFIKAMDGTWIPIAVASLAGPSMVSAPLATIAGAVAGGVGNKLVDTASEAATGLDFGSNIAKFTPLTPDMAGWLNPGGWYSAPRGAATGDALQTSLTGKSREFMKPLVRKYLGEPYYNNIRPSGYGNSEGNRNAEYRGMIKDFLTPLFLRKDVSDSNFIPNWIMGKDNPTVFEIFRNDAHRLSMGLKPHQEILSDGKPHSLYVKKANGKHDDDWDYIRQVKRKYSNNGIEMQSADFPNGVRYIEGNNPSDGSVVANDFITGNGGYGTFSFNPDRVYRFQPFTKRADIESPTHFSTGDVTFTDTWDVQPLLDTRSAKPGLSEWLTRTSDKKIPIISKAAKNFKEVELVDALGGHPFTQETILPEQDIYWYAPKETLENQMTRTMKKYGQTLNLLQW